MQRAHRPGSDSAEIATPVPASAESSQVSAGPDNTVVAEAVAAAREEVPAELSYLDALAAHDHDVSREEGEVGHDHDHDHDVAELEAVGEDNPLRRQSDPMPAVDGPQTSTVAGIQISGEGVSPSAMQAAARVLQATIGGNPAMQERMADRDVRVVIVPAGSSLTTLPEFADLHDEETRDGGRLWQDVRGVGGHRHRGDIVVAIPEENLIDSAERFDTYGENQNIGIHEFAHAINRQGMTRSQKRELRDLYRQQGGDTDGFTDAYAASHVEEYFAQASQYFFAASDYATRHDPTIMEHGANDGPGYLRRTDPDMYAFLVSIYGEPQEGLERAEGVDVDRHEDGTPVVAASRPATPSTASTTA